MKKSQLKELDKTELIERLKILRKEILNLRLQGSSQALPNPLKKREVRKEIARILTFLAQKEKGEGDVGKEK